MFYLIVVVMQYLVHYFNLNSVAKIHTIAETIGLESPNSIYKREPDLHIGLIPDGNRRYMNQMQTNTLENSILKMHEVINHCAQHPRVKYLTVYCLSQDNIHRSPTDLRVIRESVLKFFQKFFQKKKQPFNPNIVFNIVSTDEQSIHKFLKKEPVFQYLYDKYNNKSSSNVQLYCNLLVNYSGMADLELAARDPRGFKNAMMLANFPQIDKLIRTGGFKRLSDFPMYHCSYTNMYFLDVLFPLLSIDDVNAVIYDKVENNYGR